MSKKKNSVSKTAPVATSTGTKTNINPTKPTGSRSATASSRVSTSRASVWRGTMPAAVGYEPFRVLDSTVTHLWRWVAAWLLAAVVLRLLWLGHGPFSHDEAIHANFSLHFADYKYDPIYHGPLLYHLIATNFWLFGDSDFMARLAPALLGIAMLVVVLATRRWLGARAMLCSLALLVISPVITTYSRHLIHDSLVMLLTLGAVICFQTARDHPSTTWRGRWARIGVTSMLALMLTTKANAFFILAMLLSFWVSYKASGLLRGERKATWPFWVPLLALLAVALVSIVINREVHWHERFFSLFCVASVLVVWEWMRRTPEYSHPAAADGAVDETVKTSDGARNLWHWITPWLCAAAGFFLFAFFYGHGYLWLSDPSAISRYWGDVVGPDSAIPKMLRYWGGQQANPRLPGRHDYYIVLMTLYELPIALAGLCGLVYLCRHRSPFTDLLIWWALTSFVLYSLANEKVPWLMTHIMLPVALLAGTWIAQHWEQFVESNADAANRRTSSTRHVGSPVKTWSIVAGVTGAVFLLRNLSATNFERPADRREPMFYAQATEDFRDKLMNGLRDTAPSYANIWVHPDKSWPLVWYMRSTAPYMGQSAVQWSRIPIDAPLRLAVQLTPEDWSAAIKAGKVTQEQWQEAQARLSGWQSQSADFIIWPRASWSALRPGTFVTWWISRQASIENGVLKEWSVSPVVVSTPPQN
jgi:uncharacterized protein (TIGR03663 family)